MSAPVDAGNTICERSDLPMSMCGHCRNLAEWNRQFASEARERGRVRAPSKLGRWFRAAYSGECSRCDAPFEAGEDIRADYPSGWIRKACHKGARARREAA